MRALFFLFGLLIFSFACNGKRENSIEQKKAHAEISSQEQQKVSKKDLTFEDTQDSLRTLLLNSKPNKNLKSNILQELYIRGLVHPLNGKINFQLPFNLHGLDCGVPDCYSTDISFEIPESIPVEFPEKINFSLIEHGCVDQEIATNGVFELVEESTEYVNYFSKKLKSNLIIKQGQNLYYYPHQESHSVNVETVNKMFENHDFEKENAIVPYRSTIMITNEYQHFIIKE